MFLQQDPINGCVKSINYIHTRVATILEHFSLYCSMHMYMYMHRHVQTICVMPNIKLYICELHLNYVSFGTLADRNTFRHKQELQEVSTFGINGIPMCIKGKNRTKHRWVWL